MSDGCSALLTCGTCMTAGDTCGGGGTANVCGRGACAPTTCTAQGKNCGAIPDGCGSMLPCGTCMTAGETCGGGGTANVCGRGACAPTTCTAQGKNCGSISDGCGNMLPCGTCMTAGETCGGGGTANVCGRGSCTPTTCLAQGKNCGSIPDGCGNMLPCGTCSGAGQTCGGGGVTNVCGGTCLVSCPTGFTCDSLGVCSGGNLQGLAFDVRTFTLSGTVTQNGVAPTATGCTTSPRGYVVFTETTQGYTFSLPIACMGTPATFTGSVYPGTYKVTIAGNTAVGSSLPGVAQVVQDALVVNGNVTSLAYDVRTYTLSGTVTQNGAAPTATGCTTSPRGYVVFTDAAQGYSFNLQIACMGTPATFTGSVFPGTYKVTISGNTAVGSSLPGVPQVVQQALVVTGNLASLAYDVRTYTLSGTVTQNGTAPTATGCTTSPRGYVVFTDATQGYTFTLPIACMGTPATFTGSVFPGTYKVTIYGNTAVGSSLPGVSQVVQQSLVVNGNVPGLAYDVRTYTLSGTVTQNGMVPTATGCSTSPRGYVVFTDAAQGYTFTLPIACMGSPAAFTGNVFPGTYKVTVYGNTAVGASLPGVSQVVQQSLVVTGNLASLAYDVRTYTASGTVTQNGMVPTATGCTTSPRGYVVFTETTQGYTFNLPIACMGTPAAFTGSVFPGTYKVGVYGNTAVGSSLPGPTQIVARALSINADTPGLSYDVVTRTVSGTVTQNGMVPTATGCTTSPRGYITFTEPVDSLTFSLPIACMGSPAAFTGSVFPGTYRVTVSGNTAVGSSLPGTAQVVAERLRVP